MRYRGYPRYSEPLAETGATFPKNWNIERLRFSIQSNPLKSEIADMNLDELVTFVPMEAIGEYGGIDTTQEKPLGNVYSGYTYFKEGDILIAKITPCFENGKGAIAVGLKNCIGFGTTEFHVLRPLKGISTRWLFYLTLSDFFRRMGAAEMQGAGGQKRVPEPFIRDFRTGIPSLFEQQQIADFLDYKTAQIDALFARKKELIEKLREQLIAVITKAVTKGLDSSAPMRDSGLDSIGPVPEHWDILRLRRMVTLQRGVDITKDEQEEGDIPVVSSGGIASYHSVALVKGPGVIVGRKGTAGSVHYVTSDYWPHDTTLYVKDYWGNDPRFVYYKLLSMNLASFDTGTANPTVNRNRVHPEIVSWPPVKEQTEIVSFLDGVTERIDLMIEKVTFAINSLMEYRTALIAAATTGKIDVRNLRFGKAK